MLQDIIKLLRVMLVSALALAGALIGFFVIPAVGLLLGQDPTMAPMWGIILAPLGFILGLPVGVLKWWFSRRRP